MQEKIAKKSPVEIISNFHNFNLGKYKMLSKATAQIVEFGAQMGDQLDNEFIDGMMAIKPQRQEGEEEQFYKNRSRLQKLLLKFRSHLYQRTLSIEPKKYSSKRDKYLRKKLGII